MVVLGFNHDHAFVGPAGRAALFAAQLGQHVAKPHAIAPAFPQIVKGGAGLVAASQAVKPKAPMVAEVAEGLRQRGVGYGQMWLPEAACLICILRKLDVLNMFHESECGRLSWCSLLLPCNCTVSKLRQLSTPRFGIVIGTVT